MKSLALKKTRNGAEMLREGSLAEFLPYTRHVDDATVATKDGYLFQVIKIDGFAFETADASELNHLKNVRNTMLRGIATSRHALYHHVIRRAASGYPGGDFDDAFCAALDRTWEARLAAKRLFVNDQYLTVVRRSLRGTAGFAEQVGRLLSSAADRAALEAHRQADLKALYEATDTLSGALEKYGARRLSVYEADCGTCSEVLEFLSYLINQSLRPIRLPRAALDAYLPYKRLLFGRETLEIRGPARGDSIFAAILSIKEYAPATGAGLLDNLLRLPHELVIAQSFAFIDRQRALERLARTGRIMDNAEDAAVSLRHELDEAADELAAGRIAFGEHHLTVLVKGQDQASLDAAITDVIGAATDLGILAVREDLNLEAAFWAQMPGNFAFIARKAEISTQNFAAYASLHNFPQGQRAGNWWGDCVTVLETTSGTPYAFNFHHHDLGNFTVIGPSGTGKTVVLCFLMAQAQRFKPLSVFFDKDRGAEIFIRAIGGQYSVIRPGHPSGFNPLQLPDTPVNRAFLRDWLAQLARPLDGSALSPEDRALITGAVEGNYQVPMEHRRLSVLQELLQGHERPGANTLAARIRPWFGAGERAWLFDNAQDALGFKTRTTGFDLTFILDDMIGRPPALMYLFHRVDQFLSGQRAIVFIDEAWKGLQDAYVAARIEDWQRTIRKRGGLVGLGSQSAESLISSPIGNVIVEQSPTQLFMPNHKADETAYCGGFGLTREELRWVRELSDTSRCFLIKHGTHSVIARLDLGGEDELLAVLSGRQETVNLLDEIRAEAGDDPAAWLPLFHAKLLTVS